MGTKPVVANHLNIPKPTAGQPTLMTLDEVNTMFHEFGHALHGMFSDVKYPYFRGTSVPRDFVEFPSQVNEMWADWPEILANYAKHCKTGEPMPKELLDKVLAAEKFNQGFTTTEYLGRGDARPEMASGSAGPGAGATADAFEEKALKDVGVDYAAGAAALPHHLLLAHHGRLLGRLLRLHLVGSAGRRPPWSGSRNTAA